MNKPLQPDMEHRHEKYEKRYHQCAARRDQENSMTESRGAMTAQQFMETEWMVIKPWPASLIVTVADWLIFADALSAHNTAQLQKEVERTKGYDAVLAEVGKLQGIVEAGDAENVELRAALEAIQGQMRTLNEENAGFRKELAEAAMEINCAGPIAHRIRILKNSHQSELERLRSQGAGQWEAAAREAAKEIKTSPTGHMTCRLSEGHIFDIILKHFAGLASPPEGKP